MTSNQVLSELQPHVSEIVSVMQRRPGDDVEPAYDGDTALHQQRAAYLAVVDGEHYVVSVEDRQMPKKSVLRTADNINRLDIYADPDAKQQWIRRSRVGQQIATFGRRFFEGYVLVSGRDSHDAYEGASLNYGQIGYTLRRGNVAVLHETSAMPEDPDFFMRAIRAARPDTRINPNTNLTTLEEERLQTMHEPVIASTKRLVQRDGLPAPEAYDRWGDMATSPELAIVFNTKAALGKSRNPNSRVAFYDIGDNGHLLLEEVDGDKGIRLALERVNPDGSTTFKNVSSRRDNPGILMDVPPGGDFSTIHHDAKRLLTLGQEDIDRLTQLLTPLKA